MLLDKGHVLIAGNSRKIFQDPVTCKAARLTGCKNISKIERIGEYRVRALDWDNLEFVTDRTLEMILQQLVSVPMILSLWQEKKQRPKKRREKKT